MWILMLGCKGLKNHKTSAKKVLLISGIKRCCRGFIAAKLNYTFCVLSQMTTDSFATEKSPKEIQA